MAVKAEIIEVVVLNMELALPEVHEVTQKKKKVLVRKKIVKRALPALPDVVMRKVSPLLNRYNQKFR